MPNMRVSSVTCFIAGLAIGANILKQEMGNKELLLGINMLPLLIYAAWRTEGTYREKILNGSLLIFGMLVAHIALRAATGFKPTSSSISDDDMDFRP